MFVSPLYTHFISRVCLYHHGESNCFDKSFFESFLKFRFERIGYLVSWHVLKTLFWFWVKSWTIYLNCLNRVCLFVCMLCVSNVYGAIAIKDALSNFGNIAYFEWTKKGKFHLLWILDQNHPPLCKGEMMESM